VGDRVGVAVVGDEVGVAVRQTFVLSQIPQVLFGLSDGDPYGHPSHCYKGKSLLFNHGDLEGESRLEMTGSTSSIRIRMQTKKLKIKFCL
jgi:hypothetical protein